jgi:ribosomal protein L37AE/L43A
MANDAAEDIDEDRVACPSCKGQCERVGVGLWVCERCVAAWNPNELGQPGLQKGKPS